MKYASQDEELFAKFEKIYESIISDLTALDPSSKVKPDLYRESLSSLKEIISLRKKAMSLNKEKLLGLSLKRFNLAGVNNE